MPQRRLIVASNHGLKARSEASNLAVPTSHDDCVELEDVLAVRPRGKHLRPCITRAVHAGTKSSALPARNRQRFPSTTTRRETHRFACQAPLHGLQSAQKQPEAFSGNPLGAKRRFNNAIPLLRHTRFFLARGSLMARSSLEIRHFSSEFFWLKHSLPAQFHIQPRMGTFQEILHLLC